MRVASIPTSFLASSIAWLLLAAAMLPSLVHSAPPSSSDQATHDGLRKLTAANFTLTNQGAWLIEFFSPTCIHCKRFGATWSELSQTKDSLRTQYPQAPFTLAQVDCLAQWDLCKEQGVTFLPRLTIYQDGKQNAEEYKGNRNYPEISAYIDKFAKEYRETKGVPDVPVVASTTDNAKTIDSASAAVTSSPTASAAASEPMTSPASDGVVAVPSSSSAPASTSATLSSSAASSASEIPLPSGPNPKGELIRYGSAPIQTKEQLADWLDETSGQGPTFVKFFAPWCPHCKAMAAAFKQLSESLKGRVNVVEVDCEANRALCSTYRITGYPVLRLYDQGHIKEYTGGRNHDAMLKWVIKGVSNSGLKTISTTTEFADLAKDNEVMFLYLHSPGTSSEEKQAVVAASNVLFGGRALILSSSEPALLDRYASSLAQDSSATVPSASGLLVFKDFSVAQPVSVLNPSKVRATDAASEKTVSLDHLRAKITRFFAREQYPLVTELTAANFEEVVRNNEDALVVLAALSDTNHGPQRIDSAEEGTALKQAELQALRSTALEWREQSAATSRKLVVFAWIDADRWKSPLRKLYGIDAAKVPAAVLVDGNNMRYYDLPYRPMSDASVASAQRWLTDEVLTGIDHAIQGRSTPKSSSGLLQKSVHGAADSAESFVQACVKHPIIAFLFVTLVVGGLFSVLRRSSTGAASLPLYSKVSTVKAD
ncbi:Thioredoxin domain protein [Kalmanozyma brasiliensis GHG001]|uniref:Thioredoxin domain-containing protein n=1 Tax=Kalmanozyma brasiliensis (strain GHG001) TaxID=1365824 RepID=V5GLG9_KALBG|nr:Thioredoxin domain protein [Kalmanozyma brasiliensis GHG001]EST06812.1 Thioredoxin domain protein [Kalmanozyma brasiliensis GHG001]